jgi:hypothetical protein
VTPLCRHWQVDDLGGLLAIACANARNIEASRGLLGFLNTLGGWALRAAHAARSNTISGARSAAVNDGISRIMYSRSSHRDGMQRVCSAAPALQMHVQ